MPIIYQTRLGNSKSDKRLRKVFKAHHILWLGYYAVIMAASGITIAILARGTPLFSLLIIICTVGAVSIFFWFNLRKHKFRRIR